MNKKRKKMCILCQFLSFGIFFMVVSHSMAFILKENRWPNLKIQERMRSG